MLGKTLLEILLLNKRYNNYSKTPAGGDTPKQEWRIMRTFIIWPIRCAMAQDSLKNQNQYRKQNKKENYFFHFTLAHSISGKTEIQEWKSIFRPYILKTQTR